MGRDERFAPRRPNGLLRVSEAVYERLTGPAGWIFLRRSNFMLSRDRIALPHTGARTIMLPGCCADRDR